MTRLSPFFFLFFYVLLFSFLFFFFFNDTATTEIYTLSLHDALPISSGLHDEIGFGGKELLGLCDTAQSVARSEEHTSELQSHSDLVCRLLLEKKKKKQTKQDKQKQKKRKKIRTNINVTRRHGETVKT